jgi:hypothetical protein
MKERCRSRGDPMSNDQGGAIFHAARLLQLYEETESVEAVTEAATALLARRPGDHVSGRLPPAPLSFNVIRERHRSPPSSGVAR